MIADSLHAPPSLWSLAMAHPFLPVPGRARLDLQVLVAASGRLSGDGQLRELMQERRRHLHSPSGGLWSLSPARMRELGHPEGLEGLAIEDPKAATWLQLRFGGSLRPMALSAEGLDRLAQALPASAARPAWS